MFFLLVSKKRHCCYTNPDTFMHALSPEEAFQDLELYNDKKLRLKLFNGKSMACKTRPLITLVSRQETFCSKLTCFCYFFVGVVLLPFSLYFVILRHEVSNHIRLWIKRQNNNAKLLTLKLLASYLTRFIYFCPFGHN